MLERVAKKKVYKDLHKNDNILARKNDNILDLRVTLNWNKEDILSLSKWEIFIIDIS